MITIKTVKNTIWFSLILQIITGLIPLPGLFIKLEEKDAILSDILFLETIVQFIELLFYVWIAFSVLNIKKMASRRYIDWMITTPTMLLSTIMFMKYQERKENNELENKPLKTMGFIKENKDLILKIFGFNFLMLLFGYLGEINTISKYIAIPIGFGFFYKSFELIFNNYASVTNKGRNLFLFLVSVWSLYGVAAIMSPNVKNISYNLLDIVAKNFYGLYIYYEIRQMTI
jgi:bacteriorhodopsin|tara:strand:+ start:158 stop:847 length:690 start_codon:yes stop_codon:yes gene_type:complete